MIRQLWTGLLDLIYPSSCLLCRNELKVKDGTPSLCPACQSTLEFNRPPYCSYCGRHVEITLEDSFRCLACEGNTFSFDRAWSVFFYNDPLRHLLHLFKYGQKTSLRHYFSSRMIEFIDTQGLKIHDFEVLYPMPLSQTRLRERGYNQSRLLAERISQHFQIPLEDKNLQRLRHTPYQARLSQKERWTNIQGAFKINHPREIKNKSILLIDDLLTTGATASAAASELCEAGANQVAVLTLAIAG